MWFHLYQKQTKQIKEKQTSVMAELAKVEPAVQEAKMGKLFFSFLTLDSGSVQVIARQKQTRQFAKLESKSLCQW